jgi:hypothetical protein
MEGSFVRKTMDALCVRTLPIRPGDMLCFLASGHRFMVVASSEQCAQSGSAGQRIAGMMSATHAWWWSDFWIDWAGLDSIWTIHRTTV